MGHGQQGDEGGYRSSFAAIKRSDPHAKEIIDGPYRVAVFTLNDETNVWIRTFPDVSVLIYSRDAEPKYVLFTDYSIGSGEMALLTPEKKFKAEGPLLFYKNELDCTRCFRFQTDDDCNRFDELIQQIMERVEPIQLRSPQTKRYGGILTMLATAQEVFDNSAQPSQVEEVNSSDTIITPVASNPSKKRTLPEHIRVDQIDKRQRTLLDPVGQIHSSSDHLLLASKTKHSTQETGRSLTATEPLSSKISSQTKPKLFSPLMFTTVTKKSSKDTGISALLTQAESVSSEVVRVNQSVALEKPEPLTQNQLLQAVSYLMKKDKGFVKKLHEAYLQSFIEML